MPDPLAGRGVTEREAEVLALLAERLTNAEVADRLTVSERTVESHVSSLLKKLGATNRIELAQIARDLARPAAERSLPGPLSALADPATFVGRASERARLRDAWTRAVEGHSSAVVLAGEAGIGKSRLAAELAAEVHADGAVVMLGACFEGLPLSYGPLVQAVTDDAAGLTDAELARRCAGAEPWTRLVPEIAVRLGLDSPAAVFDAHDAQAGALAALRTYLARAATTAPLLLVVEDAHWATTTTLDALRFLAGSGGSAPVLIVVTTRDSAPDVTEALTVFLADLRRMPTVERIDLVGLRDDEVAQLLGPENDAVAVAAGTGGNPLLVREMAEGHAQRGSLPSLLARRYGLLDADALELLDIASVVGTEVDVGVLAGATGRSVADVYDGLERIEAAGLVSPLVGRVARYGFVHAIFRTARYDAIPMGRRLTLHGQVADALERRGGGGQAVVELARHAVIAAPVRDARRAIDSAVAAARLAERSLALDEAAAHYRDALACADLLAPTDPQLALELRTRLGEALHGSGSPEYHAVLVDAAAQARALGDVEALAEVGWAIVKYGGPRDPGSPDQLLLADISRDALTGLGPAPSASRARTLAAAAEDLCLTDLVVARTLVDDAIGMARAAGDPVTLGHVLLAQRIVARGPGSSDAVEATVRELITIADAVGEPMFAMLGHVTRAWLLRESGDIDDADAALSAALAIRGEELLPPVFRTATRLFRSSSQLMRGDLAAAAATANEVLALASPTFNPANWYGPALILLQHSEGTLPALLPLMEAAGEQPGIGTAYRAALAVAYAQADRADDARRVTGALLDAGIPANFTWLASHVALAEAAELSHDADAAREIAAALVPHAACIAELPQTVIAPVDLALAQCALAVGDADAATRWSAHAVDAARRRGTPVFLARALLRQAATGGDGTDEALALAARTGARLIDAEAARLRLS